MTMRPASISERIVVSLRTTGAESIRGGTQTTRAKKAQGLSGGDRLPRTDGNGKVTADIRLKRIVLPSGKTIEVVYFDQVDRPAVTNERRPQPQRTEERELHVCPQCESDLVYPTTWEEADESHWQVSLRCPNCEHFEQGVYSQDECDRFDDHLEAGTDALTRDFKRLMAANMAEEIDRFVAALDADAIQPMDF